MDRSPEFDPLSIIPSSGLLRSRLEEAQRRARKLKILLDVATKIEAEDAGAPKEVSREPQPA